MKTKVQISILFIFANLSLLHAQVSPTDAVPDSVMQTQDTLPVGQNSLNPALQQVRLSKDTIDVPIKYSARDSMEYDIANRKIYLYGGAEVTYQTLNLKAGYIEFDWESGIVTAEGRVDSIGRTVEIPEFADGDQQFKSQRMRYNFDNQKGVIYDVSTTQQNLYVLGEKSKFVRREVERGDSIATEDIIYSQDAIFTTCNHPQPHYGIRSKKQKVIPGKLVVVGPSNLELGGVPTPLWLPFGFFPVTETRSQGIIFPRDYEYSPQWGFGLRDVAYYIPISDYMDLTVSGDIYLKGTWGLSLAANYRKRYRYNGSASLGFSSRRTENNEGQVSFQNSYALRVSHNQDSRAHPTRKLGGSINIQTNGFQQLNQNDANSVLQGQLSSNFSYSQIFPGKPYNLSVSFNHSQNTRTGDINISFPTVNFATQTMYPLKRQERIGQERWYERIAVRYRGEARNSLTAKDTTLFTQQTLREAQFGARHDATLNTSFKVFKYFSVNPNVSYEEVWNFKSIERDFVPNLEIEQDTIFNPIDSTDFTVVSDTLRFGDVDVDTLFGFRPTREFTASVGVNTQIFGTLLFKKGWLRGVRHVVKPSVSFNYTPDYTNPSLEYYKSYVRQTDAMDFDTIQYSVFEGGIYGSPSRSGEQMSLSYAINNIFEAKYFSKKDSTEQRFKLFDNIYIRGNYNFAADSLNWSQVSVSGTTRLFKGISTLNVNARWDPYDANENGQRVNQLYWRTQSSLLRFVDASFRLTTRLTVRQIRELFNREDESSNNRQQIDGPRERGQQEEAPKTLAQQESLLDVFENFSLSHNFNLDLRRINGRDTLIVSTHAINVNGNLQLTPNWSIRVGNFGYDFRSNQFTYPAFGFVRNLHCWQMSFDWFPTRNTYNFSLFVRDNPLSFIRIPYGQNNADGRFRGF